MKTHRFTLADGDPNTVFLLHRMLARLYPKSSIAVFSDAEDALTHILETGTDILIANHGIGQMSGTGLVRELRLRKWPMPIIMISGSPSVEQEAISAGATKFVHKGVAPRVFEAHIRAVVELLPTKEFKQPQGKAGSPLKRHSPRPTRRAIKL